MIYYQYLQFNLIISQNIKLFSFVPQNYSQPPSGPVQHHLEWLWALLAVFYRHFSALLVPFGFHMPCLGNYYHIHNNFLVNFGFRTISLLASLLSLGLPETCGIDLMHTVEEAKIFHKKSYSF